jgi:uncharacterized protein YbbC (DUF1343 family)/CubicO group peptidase (beta-lactamase class C family)
MRRTAMVIGIWIGLAAGASAARGQASVAAATRAVGDLPALSVCDKLIEDAIGQRKCPGAVLLVGRGDEVVYRKAYGNKSVAPTTRPMTVDTIFDLASLTKSVATGPSVMILAERGKLDIHAPVARYIPEFGQNGKGGVTIEDLLLHRGGLVPDNDIADYANGPGEAWKKLYALELNWPVGTHFAYSDVGFETLGKLVEVVSGKPLDVFAREELFEPLKMSHTTYLPPAQWRDRIAPTQQREGRWMVGEVHDPRADALGGVAGHAGLFSDADDISRFCRMLLHGGVLEGVRVLKEMTYRSMIEARRLADGTGCRGYGFDIDTPYSGCRGDRFERGATYGHTGFTGTMFWVDPVNQCYFILLTNSVHPDGKGDVRKLRHDVATAVGEALLGKLPATQPATRIARIEMSRAPVLCGIDVMEDEKFAPLRGKRVALVTNHTGMDAAGRRTVDVLAHAPDVKLTKLFSPEHGLYGLVDAKVDDAVDSKTGLHVYSLYGKTERPSAQMLKDVDAIVYDIQDVGARYYTYTTTMGYCMQAAASAKIPIFVLDRPNPVTGLIVDGPVADEKALSFIAFAPIPVSHGMTHGELARMFNEERGIHCDLHLVAMKGWKRWMWWDDTGRVWVNPSPNMRNPNQALLYLGVGLLEGANVSVGRGTDQPFETFGAPWIDGRKLAASLNAAGIAGLRFVPITFTPTSSKFAGKACEGCFVEVVDRTAVEPVRAGVRIVATLRELFRNAFEIEGVGRLIGNEKVLKDLERGEINGKRVDDWGEEMKKFKAVREKYLMY